MAISLEIRPLAALYTAGYKAYFLYGGGGYNASRGLTSRDITKKNR